jgi:heme a synthase
MFKILINITIALTLVTIVLGAHTRLTEAGLGCPDWPGCYGFLAVPEHPTHVAQAKAEFPDAELVPHKAHNEMNHRYLASLLGLSVGVIFLLSQWLKQCRALTAFILLLVIFQAALGMWTVTLNLLPLVVMGHLLGGFSLLSLLVLLRLHSSRPVEIEAEPKLASIRIFAWLALLVLFVQIALGGWTSANYAAVVCHELPLCEAGWPQHFSLSSAFSLPLGHETYQFGVLSAEARLSIHVLHRLGAFVTLLVLGSFAFVAWRRSRTKIMRQLALGIASLLVLQCGLGVINIVAHLPLINAVAHNFVAANLFMLVVVFVYQIYQRRGVKNMPSAIAP